MSRRISFISAAVLAVTLGLLGCGGGSSGGGGGGGGGGAGPPPGGGSGSPAGPGAVFATLVDGTSDHWEMIRDVAVDGAGNIYVTGGSSSRGGIDLTSGNDFKTLQGGGTLGDFPDTDAFVMKFSPTGTLLWSARMGGAGYDRAYALEVAGGKVFIAGRAGGGLATSAGAFQTAFAGDNSQSPGYGQQDGFVARLDAQSGRLDWATYFGGGDGGYIRDLDVAADGTIHIGYSNAAGAGSDRLLTADAMVTGQAANVYAQLSNDGRRLLYGTYLGNGGAGVQSVRIDPRGDLVLEFALAGNASPAPTAGALQSRAVGQDDIYVLKLTGASGHRALAAATFLGGSGNEGAETHQVAADAQGRIYATAGHTTSSDIPVNANGYQRGNAGQGDVFIALISADGRTQLGSTYFGGSSNDSMEGIVVTNSAVYISGSTTSPNLPVTDRSTFGGYGGGQEAFVAVFSLDLSRLLYASYIGGSGDEQARSLAVDSGGSIIAGGQTTSGDLDVRNARDTRLDGAFGAFVVKIAASQVAAGG